MNTQSFVDEAKDNDASNSGENEIHNLGWQALQDVKDNEEEFDKGDIDIYKIYWLQENDVYVHLSWMRFDTKSTNYCTWANDNLEDRECLYSILNKGELTLVLSGEGWAK